MKRQVTTRLRPRILPGFTALLAALSLSGAPDSLRAMGYAITRWSAELAPPDGGGGPHGTVVMEPGKQPNHTRVRVVISGDTPGALRPWHLHRGQCGDTTAIVGPEQSYARIRINARGNGVAVIDLPIPFPDSGDLFVSVHESMKAMGTIVTCGQLVR